MKFVSLSTFAIILLFTLIISLFQPRLAVADSFSKDNPPSQTSTITDPFNDRLSIQVGSDGRFDIGAFPDPSTGSATINSWSITYGWPVFPWSSFTTIRLDGNDYIYGSSGTQLHAPADTDAKTNSSEWQVGDLQITQTLQLALNNQTGQDDVARIAYVVHNTGSTPHTVGSRIMLDTDVNHNDGAPFRVPGDGIVTTEKEYDGAAVPENFSVFQNITDSIHVANAVLKDAQSLPPDRLVIAQWPGIDNSSYDYTINPSAYITNDSAYAVYWNPSTLAPGESRTYVTAFGLGQLLTDLTPPLALGVSAPSTLTVDNNAYSPNPFTVTATVLNNGTATATNVALSINLPAGLSLDSGNTTLSVGDLAVGQQRQVSWSVKAADQNSQQTLTYSIAASASNASTKTLSKQITIPAVLVDSDGDGIPDEWETNGVYLTPEGSTSPVFIDLPAMGADPKKPDIFIQTDWMQDAQHNQQLSNTAIQKVVAAFANSPYISPTGSQGINLHIDNGPSSILDFTSGRTWGNLSQAHAIAYVASLGTMNSDGSYNWSDFQALKEANFTPTGRSPIFHYVVAAHNYGNTTSSGISRGIPSSDYIVSLGSFDNGTGSVNQQAGTLMHELGHNLGLQHGGGDSVNYKPNYLSIMSYAFQLQGLTINGTSGHFDYSHLALGNLDETNLNESSGVTGAPAGYGTMHWCSGWLWFLPGAFKAVPNSSSPIDWNCNGRPTDNAVSYDINHDNSKTSLSGFNDWQHLIFNGGAIGSAGVNPTLPLSTESDNLTVELAQQIPVVVTISVKPGSETTPINPQSQGDIPVAILSSDSFAAATVNADSVRFGVVGNEAASSHSSLEDVNGDGLPDLVLHFATSDTGIVCGTTTVTLTGKTSGVQPIQSTQPITTVDCQ